MDTTFALLFLRVKVDEDDPFSSFTSLLTVIALVLRVVVFMVIRVVIKLSNEEDVPFILTRLRLDPFSLLDQNIELPGNDLTDQPRGKAT